MAEKLEDLNLPNASVQKIIKEALPDNVNIGKDARSALSRAASVFVLYITSQASNEAQKADRKTLTGQDIIKALEELEFENFIEPLQEVLKEFKNSKTKKSKGSKTTKPNEEENGIEEGEEEIEAEETMEDV
ncbi:hypothetical protein NQ315_006320 [Exocentrus adspersus]|uniref:DNA polymerase epsilon subunit 3 n=1 Tax=Exocentrus adspersus TaxID=1586481 RepID=A0AAV8W147_9CUCU|nr:hypothetical protein NQ315_006320 [Exocentrus adspersus]